MAAAGPLLRFECAASTAETLLCACCRRACRSLFLLPMAHSRHDEAFPPRWAGRKTICSFDTHVCLHEPYEHEPYEHEPYEHEPYENVRRATARRTNACC